MRLFSVIHHKSSIINYQCLNVYYKTITSSDRPSNDSGPSHIHLSLNLVLILNIRNLIVQHTIMFSTHV